MPMVESVYESREINVPPRLPTILKQFCKAAIRTQPYDLLKWSSAYFRALAEGEEPPTKIRLEHPLPQTISGLTLGFLKVLLRQLGDYNKTLSIDAILRRWDDLCLDRRDLNLIMIIGKFRRRCQVKKFLAIAVGLLGSSLFETMLLVCQLFTLEPDGGSAMIPVSLFMEIYGYLAGLRCDGKKRESLEENPEEFLIFDQVVDSSSSSPPPPPPPPEAQSSARESTEDTPKLEQVSLASQDTRVDATVTTLDPLESSFDDTKLTTPKSSVRGDSCTSSEIDRESKAPSFEAVDSGASSSKELLTGESSQESSRNPDQSSPTNNNFGDPGKIDGKLNSDNARKKDVTVISYYPNIPGIGPRLLPEQVAAVAIWITECAKLQEGMVGPRNLRHLNCPPMDWPHPSLES